jgi:hypothetical protein
LVLVLLPEPVPPPELDCEPGAVDGEVIDCDGLDGDAVGDVVDDGDDVDGDDADGDAPDVCACVPAAAASANAAATANEFNLSSSLAISCPLHCIYS